MANRLICVVSATPLWAAWDDRLCRAELPLLPREIWPSSPNGGVRFPAGFRIIEPVAAAVRPPNCNRLCPLNPIPRDHRKPPAQGRKLPCRRLPRRRWPRARTATNDLKSRFRIWRVPGPAATPTGRLLHSLAQVYRMLIYIPWRRFRSAAGRRSWTWGCCCSVTVECSRSLQFWADISVLTSWT